MGASLGKHASSDDIRDEDVIFILPATHSTTGCSGYMVYSLKERGENGQSPFILESAWQQRIKYGLRRYLIRDLSNLPPHLAADLHVIISTRSGVGQAQIFYDDVLKKLLAALGLRPRQSSSRLPTDRQTHERGYNVVVTTSSATVQEFARDVLDASQSSCVVLLSGDGGMADLLNNTIVNSRTRLPKSDPLAPIGSHTNQSLGGPTVALLPLGTGNALFHSIHKPLYRQSKRSTDSENDNDIDNNAGCPTPLVLALRTLFLGHARKLPAFRARFSPGARLILAPPTNTPANNDQPHVPLSRRGSDDNDLLGTIVASYGLHASLVHESDTPAMRQFGARRFAMAAETLLSKPHAYRAIVEYLPASMAHDGCSTSRGVNPPAAVSGEITSRQGDHVGEGKVSGSDLRTWTRIPGAVATGTPGRAGTGECADDDTHGYLLAAHTSNLEREFCISPASRALDGRLWLVHFAPLPGPCVMEIMQAAYAGGRHVLGSVGGDENSGVTDGKGIVRYIPIDAVRVTVNEPDSRWRHVCIDGTIVELEQGGWMEVRRGAESGMSILVPRAVCGSRDLAGRSSSKKWKRAVGPRL